MATNSTGRWNASRYAEYLQAKAGEAKERDARTSGQLIVRNLDRIWRDLSEDERGLMEFLLSEGAPASFVAAYDEPVLRSLVEKGLLQLPRGVGGNWMRALRTSFQLPPAVHDKIRANADQYFGKDPEQQSQRRTNAEVFLKSNAVY
jgi:hypothetical protein